MAFGYALIVFKLWFTLCKVQELKEYCIQMSRSNIQNKNFPLKTNPGQLLII